VTELLPCPFCGVTLDAKRSETFDELGKWGYVKCCIIGPDVRTDYKPLEHWRQAAIDAWNTRA